MPGHVYWQDLEFRYLGCNKAHARSAGLASPKDIVGKTNFDLPWKDQAEELHKINRKVVETGVEHTKEESGYMADGTYRTFISKKVPLRDINNKIIGILGLSFDITEKKKLEEELQETQQKLEGMTLVSATIAHELRTPLASLGLSIDAFREVFPRLKQAYQRAVDEKFFPEDPTLDFINEAEGRLATMKSEIRAAFTFIDMSLMKSSLSIEAGKIETFSISQCVEESLDRYPFDFEERDIIRWSNNRNNDFLVKSDKLLLIHVLFNLFKNALYYVAEAGKGDIQIWLEKGSVYNTLYFKDTGAGISPDILPHIFERFFTKTYHGAGVGLTFCKNVMESIRGNIACESVKDSYTLFTLTFPNCLKE